MSCRTFITLSRKITAGGPAQELGNIDTSQFVQSLKNTGFYVAECSQSNYAMESELSIGQR